MDPIEVKSVNFTWDPPSKQNLFELIKWTSEKWRIFPVHCSVLGFKVFLRGLPFLLYWYSAWARPTVIPLLVFSFVASCISSKLNLKFRQFILCLNFVNPTLFIFSWNSTSGLFYSHFGFGLSSLKQLKATKALFPGTSFVDGRLPCAFSC